MAPYAEYAGTVGHPAGATRQIIQSSSKSGRVAKRFSAPPSSRSVRQSQIRLFLRECFDSFVALPAGAQSAWRLYAARQTPQGRFGGTRSLSGYDSYVSVNLHRQMAGLAVSSDIPALYTSAFDISLFRLGLTTFPGTSSLILYSRSANISAVESIFARLTKALSSAAANGKESDYVCPSIDLENSFQSPDHFGDSRHYFNVSASDYSIGGCYGVKAESFSSDFVKSLHNHAEKAFLEENKIFSPPAGDTWKIGTVRLICWCLNGPAYVSIKVRKGAAAPITVTASTPNDGAFASLIPNPPITPGLYTVRVSSTADPGVYAEAIDVCTIS